MTKSFEDRFFDELDRRFARQDERFDKQDKRADSQDAKLTQILTQAQKTNGRVTALENVKGRKLNIPSNIIYLIALSSAVVLVIVAKLMHINLGGII